MRPGLQQQLNRPRKPQKPRRRLQQQLNAARNERPPQRPASLASAEAAGYPSERQHSRKSCPAAAGDCTKQEAISCKGSCPGSSDRWLEFKKSTKIFLRLLTSEMADLKKDINLYRQAAAR
jgi:hypothetical protein